MKHWHSALNLMEEMRKMINSPCYGCEERQGLCHSTCLSYKNYRLALQKAKEQKAQGIEAYRLIVTHAIKRKERWMKETR